MIKGSGGELSVESLLEKLENLNPMKDCYELAALLKMLLEIHRSPLLALPILFAVYHQTDWEIPFLVLIPRVSEVMVSLAKQGLPPNSASS